MPTPALPEIILSTKQRIQHLGRWFVAGLMLLVLFVIPSSLESWTPEVVEDPCLAVNLEVADESGATALARQCGRDVEILSARHEFGGVFAQADGSIRSVSTVSPVRARGTDGEWASIDTALRISEAGLIPGNTTMDVALSTGGDSPLVQFEDQGRSFAMWWPQGLPAPEVSGDTATYVDVYPDVDLTVSVTADGFSHSLIVNSPAAAASLPLIAFEIDTDGVVASVNQAGGIEVVDVETGELLLASGSARMWDSSTGGDNNIPPHQPLVSANSASVAMSVEDGVLTLTPDRDLLTGDVAYPVIIDPTWTGGLRANHWASVWSNFPDDSYWQDGGMTGDTTSYGDAGVGQVCDESVGMTCVSDPITVRTYYRMDTEAVRNKQIIAATFSLQQKHSWVCAGNGYDSKALVERSYQVKPEHTWNNQPGWLGHVAESTTEANFGWFCDGYGDVEFDVASMVQAAANGGNLSVTIGMRAIDESTVAQWKRYDHSTATLEVVYNTVPESVTGATVDGQACQADVPVVIDTRSPILAATITDSDGSAAADYELYRDDQKIDGYLGQLVASGTVQPWTPTEELPDGTYRWRARGTDEHAVGEWIECLFTVDATTPIITQGPHDLIYDAAGQLVAVSQPDGLTAKYSYDDAGNLLETTSYASNELSVLSVVPPQAPPGTEVTVAGTGFGAETADIGITFTGTTAPADLLTHNDTTATVLVPDGAQSGPITVSVNDEVASSENFTVGEVRPEPVITGVSATAADVGDTVTISGTGFDPTELATSVLLHRTHAPIVGISDTQITVEVPESAGTGPITVRTPGGITTTDTELVIAPRGYSVDDLMTAGRVAIDGDALELDFATAGQAGMFWFEGNAGDRLSLGLTSNSFVSAEVFGFTPYGGAFARLEFDKPQELYGRDMALGLVPLPSDGIYQVVIDTGASFTGTVTATLSTTVLGSLDIDGDPASFDVQRPGQQAEFTFTAGEGEAFSFGFSNESSANTAYNVAVYEPFGALLTHWRSILPNTTLPFETLSSGEYRVRIGTSNGAPALADVWLSREVVSGALSVDGPGVIAEFARPGQQIRMPFDGTEGQQLGLGFSQANLSYGGRNYLPGLALIDPDGNHKFLNNDADIPELTQTGTYQLLMTVGSATGHATVHLSSDLDAGTAIVDGEAIAASLSHPWQNIHLGFDADAGDSVSIGTGDIYTNGAVATVVTSPDGTTLRRQNHANLDLVDLPQTGQYRVLLIPQLDTITQLDIYLSGELDGGTLDIDGPTTTVTVERPGQNPAATFIGTAGDNVELTFADSAFTGTYYYVSLYAPDGTTLVNRTFRGSDRPVAVPALPDDGTYRIVVDPDYAATGPITIGVASAAQAGEPQTEMLEACSVKPGEPTVLPAANLARSDWGNPPSFFDYRNCDPVVVEEEPDDQNPQDSSARTATSDGIWTPDTGHLNGDDWITDYGPAEDADLGPDAAAGVTAISGQVTAINGAPLAGVTVTVEDESVVTDAMGRFLVTDVTAGRRVVTVNGSTANTADASYGVFDIGVNVTEGQTRRMGHPVYLPQLDTDNTVSVSSSSSEETVLTSPAIPGLEVRIPAGTTIRDGDGDVVTELSITPIPIDRPPFPLPNRHVPIYFTVQPGGGHLFPAGGQIIYPNYTDQAPGSRMDFWFYDPDHKGWHLYGKGTVSSDGTQVIPDADTKFYRLTGAMTAVPGVSPPLRSPAPGGVKVGDPVDVATGLLVDESTDLFLDDVIPLDLTRTYQQGDVEIRPFGVGMNFTYNYFPWSPGQVDEFDYLEADLFAPDGSKVHYQRITPGEGPGSFINAAFAADPTPTMFSGSTLAWNGHGWDVTLRDGTVFVLGDEAPLQSIRDRYGNTVTITREWIEPDSRGRLRAHGPVTQITSPNGKWIRFSYDDPNFEQVITKAEDHLGRVVLYEYDDEGRLIRVTDPDGGTTEYTYDADGLMLTITDARGTTFLTNEYDEQGRVSEQFVVDEGVFTFDYTENSDGTIVETLVTHPEGSVDRYTFNENGQTTSETFGYGTPEAQTTTIERDDDGVHPSAYVDELGRRTEVTYNEYGEVIATTVLAGTPEARTELTPRDGPFAQLSSFTDAYGAVTEYDYGADGALSTVTDPLGNTTTFTVNGDGQVTETTNPLGDTITTTYLLGDPVAITDALGQATTMVFDAAGRVIEITDPTGATATSTYDILDQVVTVTDALGRTTAFQYDAGGNQTKVIDSRGGETSFGYDAMGKVTSITDPLGAVETLEYDGNGNIARHTSRAGVVIEFEYDELDREILIRYGVSGGSAESTTTLTYDDGSRLIAVTDSIAGDSTFAYDGLDRITESTTPQGVVAYEYGAADQWRTVSADGTDVATYRYDANGWFTTAEQGGTVVAEIDRDPLGRPSIISSGQAAQEYHYDAGGNVTEIAYTAAGTPLGQLKYDDNAIGVPVAVSGSLARTTIPDDFGPAEYDLANRLTDIAGTAIGYDADGNLTEDGETTYEWDARGQLVGMTSPGMTATFGYDASGQRTNRTVNGSTTEYLYDGINPLQEITNDGVTTQISGGIDQFFIRDTDDQQLSYLTDLVGSTIALVDETGDLATEYTYEPFGETSADGDDTGNPYRFTGREDDGTGLYQYRTRYYSPSLQRFISEDTIGFASGDTNLHAYALNQPTTLVDPMGTKPGQPGGSRGGRGSCLSNSFTPDTPVLMADGTTKPIDEVEIGDEVIATDPTTGETGPRAVIALIEGQGEKTLVDITIDTDGDGTGDTTITATDGHPFWVESTQEWRDALDLRPSDLLRTSAGTWVQVTAVSTRTESATVHNLTVDDLHTYHVAAGQADVLVHNTNPNCVKTGLGDNRAKFKDHYLDHRDILQKHLGKQYPKWKKDKGKEFLDDLHKMMTTGRLQYQGLGTLKKGQEAAHIFRGEGLTVVVDQRGNFWTLLKSGTGMDKGIVMLL